MTDERSFIEAVLEAPEDVELRMVVADWYESHGDPRAEFIRVQLALHRLPNPHPWRKEMQSRERELFCQHQSRWNAPAYRLLNASPLKNKLQARRAPLRGWVYRRGFIEVIRCETTTFLKQADLLFKLGPIRIARLFGAAEFLSRVLSSRQLERLSGLDLSHNGIGDAGVLQLAASPGIEHFTELNLTANNFGDLGAAALAESPYLRNLKRLIVSQNSFGFETISQLNVRFGDIVQHENGDVLGKRLWARISRQHEKAGPREISYDDHLLYEDGHMFDEGQRRKATDNPNDLKDEWYEENDFDVYDERDDDSDDGWSDMRRDTVDDEADY